MSEQVETETLLPIPKEDLWLALSTSQRLCPELAEHSHLHRYSKLTKS